LISSVANSLFFVLLFFIPLISISDREKWIRPFPTQTS